MARLYNGFNALALGQAINNTNDAVHQRRLSGLNALGGALQDFARSYQEEEEKKRQRQSAMDFLTGNGMNPENAQAMVNSGIAPGDLTKYMQGRIDAASDKADDRAYSEKRYGIERTDKLSDRDAQWAHDLEVWAKQNGVTNEQAIKMAIFGQLMNNRGIILSKNYGNSRAGVDDLNSNTSQLQDFMKNNPSFAFDIGLLPQGNLVEDENKFYDEDIVEKLKELGNKSVTDAQREEYLKELQKANKLTYVQSNPELFRDALTIFVANADNKKLSPYLNLERVIGGTTTAPQRNREQKAAAFANKVASIKSKLESEAGKPWGEGKLPEGIDERVKKELKKDKTAWSRYQKLGGS